LELKYRLSRQCLQKLLNYKPKKITLHTRSHLILEDIQLLKLFGESLAVGISITTNNESIAREFEPNAPSIARRLNLLTHLHNAGIKVHVSMAPLLPCDPQKLIDLIAPYTQKIWIGGMNYAEINNKPDLLQKYQSFFASDNYRSTILKIKSHFAQTKLAG